MVVQREAKTRKIYFFPISFSDHLMTGTLFLLPSNVTLGRSVICANQHFCFIEKNGP